MAVPLINGIAYTWAQITVTMLGVPPTGITGISYNKSQEKVNNYGIGSKPVSRGRGRKTYEAEITFLMEELKNFIAAAPNNDILDIPPFDISIKWLDTAGLFHEVVLKYSEFMGESVDMSEGDTMVEVTVPLVVGEIVNQNIV